MKVDILGGSIPNWNEEVALEFFKEYVVVGVLDKKQQVRLGDSNENANEINNILELDEVKQYNTGTKIVDEYKKTYKQGLDKLKNTPIKELIENKPLKQKYESIKTIESLMDKAPNELSRAVVSRILESPTDEKDTKIALKEGIDNYDSYFDSLYNVTEKESNVKNGKKTTKTVTLNEMSNFREGAKFKKLVELGFTNISIKGENKDGQSYNLIEAVGNQTKAGDITSRKDGFKSKKEVTSGGKTFQTRFAMTDDSRGTTVRGLDLQEIPLYLINKIGNNTLREIKDGSRIDPLILEGAVKYDRDNKETVRKYKFLDSVPKMLEGLEKTVLSELRKEMIDIERELEDKSIYEDKEVTDYIDGKTESKRRIKEGSKFAPEQSEVMGLAKKKKISNKVAKEIVELHDKLKSDDDKKIPFEEIIGIGLSGIDYSSVEDITEKIPYQVFFKGQNKSIKSTLSAGNYVATEKQKIIEEKAQAMFSLEEDTYSEANKKIKELNIFKDSPVSFDDPKESLQKILLRYLNDLEYVFDIEFVMTKITKTTNKTEKNPKGTTKNKTEIKRFNAKRKQIIFKGGGLNPIPKNKRQTTKILESKTNISMINTFINSIRSRVDTLERGI